MTAQPRGLTAAGSYWYVLGCIAFGAMYFCKVPAKKALADAGIAKALSEIERYRQPLPRTRRSP